MKADLQTIMFSSEVSANLRDESGIAGNAEEICFPRNVKEIQDALNCLNGEKVTVQGARTGICGAAVPYGGSILNLSRMKRIIGFTFDEKNKEGSITVEPGVTLGELNHYLQRKRMDVSGFDEENAKDWEIYQKSKDTLWFLPNPTEQEATLGGIAATDAVGSHIGAKGGTAENILSMKVALPDGTLTEPEDIQRDFCGLEGSGGIAVELKLKLTKCPKYRWGILCFHHSYQSIEDYYKAFSHELEAIRVKIGAADWFSKSCYYLLQNTKKYMQNADWINAWPEDAECVLWMELWGEDEDELFEALETALDLLEQKNDFCELALAATNDTVFTRLESFRHVVIEATGEYHEKDNALFDWYLEEGSLSAAKTMTELLESAEYIMLGHMARGLTTLHILDNAKRWEESVMKLLLEKHCSYSSEHGCGRRKKEYKMKISKGREGD